MRQVFLVSQEGERDDCPTNGLRGFGSVYADVAIFLSQVWGHGNKPLNIHTIDSLFSYFF